MLHFQTLLRRAATAASSLPPQQRRAALLLGGVGVTGVVASQFMQGSTPAKVCAASWGWVGAAMRGICVLRLMTFADGR
jgi:hypothetical protein